MSLLQIFWSLFGDLWDILFLPIIFMIVVSCVLRALKLKIVDKNEKWYIGLIPLVGDIAINLYDNRIKFSLIISAIFLVLSTATYNWIVLFNGLLLGYVAEKIIATEHISEDNPVIYAIVPFYRYYKWIVAIVSHNTK